MDINDIQLVGGPCGQHGPYTFYKAFKYTKNGYKRIVTLSEFFFVKMWRDSDLLCIGELQLLWIDKNSEQMLASLRLYFLPENTPEGRMDHGEDEVLAISEKVVIKVDDLITWITVEAEWTWGRLAKCETELESVQVEADKCAPPRKANGSSLSESTLDFSDVESERKQLDSYPEESKRPHVIILSFPKYCRYRAMMKRLEGVENLYLKYKIFNALGGFYVIHPNTRVLFCRETFDYPELEGHELLCNHLAPKLKGRPRGKRKKRSVSPGSESNESESSVSNHYTRVSNSSDRTNGTRCDSPIATRRSTRCHENNENKQFLKVLNAFMKAKRIPMGRIPSLGYKELNLHEFFTKVQKLGGYDAVTVNRLWKSIFDDMSGHQNSTSAATVIRKHYERFLLAYERHLKGEEYKPLPVSERRRLKSTRRSGSYFVSSSSISDAESSSGDAPAPSTFRQNSRSPCTTENRDSNAQAKTLSLRSVRVKPERQKEKHIATEKSGVQNNNNSSINSNLPKETNIKNEPDNFNPEVKPVKPKIEKFVIKTHNIVIKTETNVQVEGEVKSEDIRIKTDTTEDKIETPQEIKMETVKEVKTETPKEVKTETSTEVKTETIIEVKIETKNIMKTEPESIKEEISDLVKSEIQKTEKSETIKAESTIKLQTQMPGKEAEPLTSAVAPVAQKMSDEKTLSPVEGKENIPLIKTGDTASGPEVIEIPYKPKPPEVISLSPPDTYKSLNIHDVKKIKLDILKEGGLEVTPVRPSLTSPTTIKDIRPSVIQPTAHIIAKPIRSEMMPPPSITSFPPKRSHTIVPQTLNYNHVKATPVTPIKPPINTDKYPGFNGLTPPKVVQSKSIYSYSEKTVYGNPKDILQTPLKLQTPKFISSSTRQVLGDPVDLSTSSPHKPVVEIMRIPQASTSPYNRDSVTKNLYKTATTPLLDGRRLGSNLEITLVGPKTAVNVPKSHNYHQQSAQLNRFPSHKRPAPESYSAKVAKTRTDENGRYKYIPSPSTHKSSGEPSVPSPYVNSSKSTSIKNDTKPVQQVQKPYPTPVTPTISPYLSQFHENANGLAPFMPLMESLYYQTAMQNIYSNNLQQMLPIPTAEQLKFYADLMAHGRLNFPFQMPQDGHSSVVNNTAKKP